MNNTNLNIATGWNFAVISDNFLMFRTIIQLKHKHTQQFQLTAFRRFQQQVSTKWRILMKKRITFYFISCLFYEHFSTIEKLNCVRQFYELVWKKNNKSIFWCFYTLRMCLIYFALDTVAFFLLTVTCFEDYGYCLTLIFVTIYNIFVFQVIKVIFIYVDILFSLYII